MNTVDRVVDDVDKGVNRVVICGSINVDHVVRTATIPKPGETIIGQAYRIFPGGKGANQAVALAKLGAQAYMVGAVGKDMDGRRAIQALEDSGVHGDGVEVVETATGTAHITVDDQGENNIIVVPGANGKLTWEQIERNLSKLPSMDIALAQMEIPQESIEQFFEWATHQGLYRVLNPAPMPKEGLSSSLLDHIDLLIPNEHELQQLTGIAITSKEAFLQAAEQLHQQGVQEVLCTVGAEGSYYSDGHTCYHVPANPAKVVDTTCAGDSYIGAYVSRYNKMPVERAMQFASTVAAHTVEQEGAQDAIPSLEELVNGHVYK